MELTNGCVAIVSDVDPEKMQVRVKFPAEEFVSFWLPVRQFLVGAYGCPVINDQVLCFFDEHRNEGVVVGVLYNDEIAPPFADKNMIGIKLGDITISLNKSNGEITISGGEVIIKGDNVTMETEKLKLSGDLEMDGNLTSQGKITAIGVIKSNQDVVAVGTHLLTHVHPTAGTGPPSPPTPGT